MATAGGGGGGLAATGGGGAFHWWRAAAGGGGGKPRREAGGGWRAGCGASRAKRATGGIACGVEGWGRLTKAAEDTVRVR